jgi:serine phosphatase RsbU (regulator of sigma subunit)
MDPLTSMTVSPIEQKIQKTILAIDDDELVRDSLSIYLEDSGYKVIQANGGAAGLKLFAEVSPDLVLCDLRMPDIDGLSVIARLAEDSPETPVIVISGAGMIQDVVEALRLGATDYLVKPIGDLTVLEHSVNTALQAADLKLENKRYRDDLEYANSELSNNLSILQQDQEAGRQAQLQLLPDPETQIGAYSFSHTIYPSLYLSGDFLDHFEIDERYIGFYIADISGHGSASAFVTMMLKSLINHPLRRYRSGADNIVINPAELCAYLNTEVINANLRKHLTLFYAVFDRKKGTLTYCNAGHFPRPVLCVEGECKTIDEKGFPIGLFEWADFQTNQMVLDKPFSLAMFSDGVLELNVGDSALEQREDQLFKLCRAGQADVASVVSDLELDSVEALPDDVTIFFFRGPGKIDDS